MSKPTKAPFQPVPGPFGGTDEQATTDAFVEYVGGHARADRLQLIWNGTPATQSDPWGRFEGKKTRRDNFIIRAEREGYTREDAEAFLSL